MVKFDNEQVEQIEAQQSENRYGTQVEKLSLKGDGATANVQFFTIQSAKNIDTYPTHLIGLVSKKGQPYTRTVACLRGVNDPVEKCPICAHGNKNKQTVSFGKSTVIDETKITYLSPIFLMDMNLAFDGTTGQYKPVLKEVETQNADGTTSINHIPRGAELKLIIARSTFRKALRDFVNKSGDITNKVVTITKHVPVDKNGKPDNFNTSYSFALNSNIQPVDCSKVELPSLENDILDKSYEDLDYFINEGTIYRNNQQDDSTPFSNEDVTRRQPSQPTQPVQPQMQQPTQSVQPQQAQGVSNPYNPQGNLNVSYTRNSYEGF